MIDRRGEAVRDAMRKLQRRMNMGRQDDMAHELGMPVSTYKYKLRDPRRFSVGDMWNIEAVARRAGLVDELRSAFHEM